jgi:hypothetical protein
MAAVDQLIEHAADLQCQVDDLSAEVRMLAAAVLFLAVILIVHEVKLWRR